MLKDKFQYIIESGQWRFFIVLFLLAVIFFLPFFLDGKAFLAADTLYGYLPWKHFAPLGFKPHNPLITDPVYSFYAGIYNKGLKEGHLNRWSPYVLGGMPGVMGGPGPYFPPKMLLHWLFPAPVALTLFLFMHVLLMGFFMFLYLREIGAGWRGALFGAVAYMFNGCVMVWLEFEMWVTAAAYFPLLLVCMERYLGQKRLRYAFAGGIVFGVLLLNSTFQLTLYIAVFMAFYLMFIIARSYGRNNSWQNVGYTVVCLVITGTTGILIGAIEILPFLELASHSSRISRTFDFHQFFDTLARVPFRYFVTLFSPDFFGNPVLQINLIPRLPTQEYMNYNELTLYAGVSTVFAFTALIAGRKNVLSWFYLLMTVLVVAMMTGTYAYYPFFKLVPGMNKMNPTRLIFLFVFVLSAGAGLGIKGIEDMTPSRRKIFIGLSLLIVTIVSFISFFGNGPEIMRWFNKEHFGAFPQPSADRLAAEIHDFRSIYSSVIYKPLMLTLASFCLFSLLVFVRKEWVKNSVFILILALLSYDLISFGRNYNTTTAPEYIYPRTPSIEFLLRQPGPFRVLLDTDSGLHVNTLSPFGLEEAGGYMSVYPDRANKFLSYIKYGEYAFEGAIFDRWVGFGSLTKDISSRVFDLMNVRYLLTAPFVQAPPGKYKLVFSEDLAIYENKEVMPRAYIVHQYAVVSDFRDELRYLASDRFDMRSQVILENEPSAEFREGIHTPGHSSETTIERYTPDEVILRADLATNGWLVLSDTHYPGWKAEVDGTEVAIRRANANFRAVELGPGKHRVVFAYRPAAARTGTVLTIVGVLLSAIGISISRKRERSDKENRTAVK
jgi:hypothetical protein